MHPFLLGMEGGKEAFDIRKDGSANTANNPFTGSGGGEEEVRGQDPQGG